MEPRRYVSLATWAQEHTQHQKETAAGSSLDGPSIEDAWETNEVDPAFEPVDVASSTGLQQAA